MKRFTFLIFCLSLSVVLLSAMVGVNEAQAATEQVWVSPEHNSSTQGWGDTHFSSIQAAVNAVSAGGIVHVSTGMYKEQVLIKKALTMIGQDRPILDGGEQSNVITIQINNTEAYSDVDGYMVTIRGLQVQNGEFGLWAASGSNRIEDNIFRNNQWHSILTDTSTNNLFVNNRMEGRGEGLMVGSSHNMISSNQFLGIGPEGPGCTGIRVGASASHNSILNNTLQNYRGHIVFLGSDSNVVAGNSISKSWDSHIPGDKMRYAGIILWNADNNQLLNNRIQNIKGAGIRLFSGSSNNRLEANTVTDTEKEGIGVYFESDHNSVRNNALHRNEQAMKVDKSSGNVLENNALDSVTTVTIPQPRGQAGKIEFYDSIFISRETLWQQDDVTLRSSLIVSANGTLTIQNSVLDIGYFNVEVQPGGRLIILDSILKGKSNINVYKGASVRVENSEFYSLGEWDGGGALDIYGDNAVIRNNLFKGAYVAIQTRGSTGHLISGNEIFNGSEGILIWDEQPDHNIQIKNNHIYNMLSGGIVGHSLAGSIIEGNTLENIHGPSIAIGAYNTGRVTQKENVVYNNNMMAGTSVMDYGRVTRWYNADHGNYWWNYQGLYPTASKHNQYAGVWNQAYRVNGNDSVNTQDLFPVIQPNIKVTVNGNYLQFDVPPIIIQGRTLVPLRVIFEALGISPQWEETTQTVTAQTDDVEMNLKIGSNVARVNGQNISLDVPSQIVNGRTLVPGRFIAETLGASVEWDNTSKTVIIKHQV